MILTLLIQWIIIDRLWSRLTDDEHERAVRDLHMAIYENGYENGANDALAKVKETVSGLTLNIEHKAPAP